MARAPAVELEEAPQSDRLLPAPHPREASRVFGHAAAADAFLSAFNSSRLHHGWLITGPRGTGKATLAWQIARFLLDAPAPGGFFAPEPAQTLESGNEELRRRVLALSEPRLFLLRRPWDEKAGRFKAEIPVDEVRRLKSFFNLSAADGGRRVVIVDAIDEMNPSAANALLKTLEEPPAGAVLLLVCHQPSRILPTIRSRCRELRLAPLSPADLSQAMLQAGIEPPEDIAALTALSSGSVGEAIRLQSAGGIEIYSALIRMFGGRSLDRAAAISMANSVAGRGSEERFDMLLVLIELLLSRLAKHAVLGPEGAAAAEGEAELFARLAPGPHAAPRWAELQQAAGLRARSGRAVNLDAAALTLDLLLAIEQAVTEDH